MPNIWWKDVHIFNIRVGIWSGTNRAETKVFEVTFQSKGYSVADKQANYNMQVNEWMNLYPTAKSKNDSLNEWSYIINKVWGNNGYH